MSDLDARCMVKKNGGLIPADVHADEFLAGIKDGREVMVTIRRARNPRHHRLLFALLHLVMENTEKWSSMDELLDDLKMATGHVSIRFDLIGGRPFAIPKSISFAAMAQDEFRAWFDLAVDVLATKVLLIDSDALHREVLAMVERRAAA